MTQYKAAGVDIDAGNALVRAIGPLAKRTRRSGCMDDLGGFGALFDLKAAGYDDPILVSCTDGVGTKLKIAIDSCQHDTVGIDLVAMCVNDLIVQGAEPLFFLDYFAAGKLENGIAERVIAGIAKGCEEAGCALIGGETAEMPGMYGAGDYDLAGFSVGAVNRHQLLPKRNLAVGDILLGLPSSGVHSNGYSLVRHIVKQQGLPWDAPAPFSPGQTLAEALMTPTRIYVKSLLPLLKQGFIKALAHITGGGLLENIPRVLPAELGAELRLPALPAVFDWLQQAGKVPADEMWRTFNCGIGMVLVVSSGQEEAIRKALQTAGESVMTLGQLIPHAGGEKVRVIT